MNQDGRLPWLIEGAPVLHCGEVFTYIGETPNGMARIWKKGEGGDRVVTKALLSPCGHNQTRRIPAKLFEEFPEALQAKALARREAVFAYLTGPQTDEEKDRHAKSIELSVRQFDRLIEIGIQAGGRAVAFIPYVNCFNNGNASIKVEKRILLRDLISEELKKNRKIRREQLVRIVDLKFKDHGFKIGRNTILREVKTTHPFEMAKSQMGLKKAKEGWGSHRGHAPVATRPLEIIEIDHTQANLFGMLADKCLRPWITKAIDVYTRMLVGLYISFNPPDTSAIGLCLFRVMTPRTKWLRKYGIEAAWPCYGKPDQIGADNGANFRSESLRALCLDHDITMAFRPVGKPNYGARIENLMGKSALAAEIHPGATFASIALRRDFPPEEMAVYSLDEIYTLFLKFFTQVYHNKPHDGLGGLSPLAKWREYTSTTGPEGLPAPARQAGSDLIYSLLPSFERKIQQDGVNWEKDWYKNEATENWIRRINPASGTTDFRFHFHPDTIKRIYWKHPDTGLYVEIPLRDPSAPDCSVPEREEARVAELARNKRLNDEDAMEAAERELQQMADDGFERAKAKQEHAKKEKQKKKGPRGRKLLREIRKNAEPASVDSDRLKQALKKSTEPAESLFPSSLFLEAKSFKKEEL